MRTKIRIQRPMSETEQWRISLLIDYGFYAKTIARRIYGGGNPKYIPSNADIRRVYKVAKVLGIQLSAWRRGETDLAKRVLNTAVRTPKTKKLKIAVA